MPVDPGRPEGGQPGADEPSDQRVRGTHGQRPPPGEHLPHDGPEQRGDHEVGAGVAGLDDAADGLCHRDAHDQRADEVEDGREADGETGLEGPGVDDGRDGITAVVEAVHHVEDESDYHHRYQLHGASAQDLKYPSFSVGAAACPSSWLMINEPPAGHNRIGASRGQAGRHRGEREQGRGRGDQREGRAGRPPARPEFLAVRSRARGRLGGRRDERLDRRQSRGQRSLPWSGARRLHPPGWPMSGSAVTAASRSFQAFWTAATSAPLMFLACVDDRLHRRASESPGRP